MILAGKDTRGSRFSSFPWVLATSDPQAQRDVIETCKLNDVEPQAYIADVLDKLVNLWPYRASTNSCHGHGPKLTPSIEARPDALAQSQPPNAVGREDRLR